MSSIVFSNFHKIYDVLIDFPLFYAIVPIILVIILYKLPIVPYDRHQLVLDCSVFVPHHDGVVSYFALVYLKSSSSKR